MQLDFLEYYDLENYLFENVRQRFHREGSLGAFDFFSIVVWKANRSKSKIARRLLQHDTEKREELDPIARDLTRSLHAAVEPKERLRILIQNWGFKLPMATAILSVLWPDVFSVYDIRVCDQLTRFHKLVNVTTFDTLWNGYQEYLNALKTSVPPQLRLRDQDRFLWGKSVAEQLERDIRRSFR